MEADTRYIINNNLRNKGWILDKSNPNCNVDFESPKSPELRKKMRAAGKSRIKLKVKVVYYTDTASATRALVKAAQNDKVQFVAYQGHRYGGFKRILGEHLSKNKNPRKTNFAFVGIHCNSYHTSTKDIVAAFSGKAYVPFGTTSSVYPPPEVTFGSITSLFIHGQAPTAKVAHKLYQKVFGKKKVNPAVMKDLPKKVYRMGDRDKDGILDHIDPDPDKQNKHVYDVKKQELEIDRAGKKVYIRKISKHYLNGLVLKHKQKVINAPKKGKKMIFAPIIVARNP